MGVVRGLKAIQQQTERNSGGGKKDYFDFKNNSLKLTDGQSVKIRFAQELDEDSPNYVKENGLGALVTEHKPSNLFPKRAVCTMDDEGECWACNRRIETGDKEWRQRTSLYINVLAEIGGEWVPKLLVQGYGPKTVPPWLVEYAGEVGTITNAVFRMKRKGSGQMDTEYSLVPSGAADSTPFDYTKFELFDIDEVLNNVPSDQMAAYFAPRQAAPAEAAEPGANEDATW